MKWKIIFIILFISFCTLFGQVTFKGEEPYTTYLIVKFKKEVVSLSENTYKTEINNIKSEFKNLKKYFYEIGAIEFEQIFRGAQWGDTVRTNYRGEVVSIKDFSQVFKVYFTKPVPQWKTIKKLKTFKDVAYVNSPVFNIPLRIPDDLHQNQWYLPKINVEDAWDISIGKNTVSIAIIDEGVDINHEDLSDKILGGEVNRSGNHGTMVAGVAAAETDNDIGIAGIGWETMITPFNWGNETGSTSDIYDAAISEYVKVINCSYFRIIRHRPGYYRPCTADEDNAQGEAIDYALNVKGKVVVASGGNPPNILSDGTEPDFSVPYTPYPAAWPGVIGISATNSNDDFPSGYNYGPHIDICAPGISIYTCDPDNNYDYHSGTSFSAPLTSGLAALCFAINSTLAPSQIENIIENSADKVSGMNGQNYTQKYGYGRINAHKTLLFASANSNKSNSNLSTAYNNSRHMVIDSYGRYHIVFEVDSCIFYRYSDDGTETWSPAVLLSDGNGGDMYPAIAERNGYIYVVWQKHIPQQIAGWINVLLFGYSPDRGENWVYAATGEYPGGFSLWYMGSGTPRDLWPCIAVEKTTSPFDMVIAFANGSSDYIRTIHTSSPTPSDGDWDNVVTVPGSQNGTHPVLIYTNGMPYTKLIWTTGSRIYYSYAYFRYNISWSNNPVYLSEGFDINQEPRANTYPTAAVSANGTIHTAWEAEDGYFYYDVIAYTKNLNTSVYSMIGNYSPYLKPSLTGHSGSTASMIWHHATGPRYIRKAYYNGSKWDADVYDCTWGEVIADNANHPSLSITNPPGGSAKGVWLKGTNPPYYLEFGPESALQKSTQKKHSIYHRRIIAKEPVSKSVFAIELGEFTINTNNGESINIKFDNLNDEEVQLSDESFSKYFVPMEIELQKDAKEITFYQGVYVQNIKEIINSEEFQIDYSIICQDNSVTLATFSDKILSTSNQKREQKTIRVNVSDLAGRRIILQPIVYGLNTKNKLDYSLVHVYLDEDVLKFRKTNPKDIPLEKSDVPSDYCLFKNYPNPFNPITTISYNLPKFSFVNISIYNLLGQLVETIVNEKVQPGYHSVKWNAGKFSSGVYIYKLKAGEFSAIGKCLLLK